MSEIILIVFVFLMLFLAVFSWQSGNPALAGYPWAGNLIYFLLFLCVGLAIWGGFGGGLHGVR